MTTAPQLATVALLVRDYDAAIAFFTGALRWSLLDDVALGAGRRWVRVGPPGGAAALQLALAETAAQQARVGSQGGDAVWLILETADFEAQHRHMLAAGVRFEEAPRDEPYGRVAIFQDLYGNRWDLIQRAH